MISARSTSLRWAAGVTVSLLALTGCGSTDNGASPTTSTTPSATTQTPKPSATPTVSPSESTGPPATTPPPTSDVPTTKPIKVKVTIAAGQVKTAADTVPVTAGDTVIITVKTDTADTLHVHGVEQELPLAPDTKNVLTIAIPADLAPGQYEVETHDNPLLLFKLQVS